MLDKTSKKLLKYLSNCPEKRIFYYNGLPEELGDEDTIYAAIRFLETKGYIEYLTANNDIHIGITLSHVGMHLGEFSRINFFEYIKDKWIEILALIISILAFIGAYRSELASIIQAITK